MSEKPGFCRNLQNPTFPDIFLSEFGPKAFVGIRRILLDPMKSDNFPIGSDAIRWDPTVGLLVLGKEAKESKGVKDVKEPNDAKDVKDTKDRGGTLTLKTLYFNG
jgi:hypothetical protein